MANDVRVSSGYAYIKTLLDSEEVRTTKASAYVKVLLDSEEVRATKVGAYVKLLIVGNVVTQAGAYAEIGGERLEATQAGAYAEASGESVIVSQAGAYAEIVRSQLIVTVVGAYVEIEEILPSYYAVEVGHNIPSSLLAKLNPQPSHEGMFITRRNYSENYRVQDDAKYAIFTYSGLGTLERFYSVIEQWGLLNSEKQDITFMARRNGEWIRYNGTAINPLSEEDKSWERFFPRNIKIYVIDVEETG